MKKFIYGVSISTEHARVLFDICNTILYEYERRIVNVFFNNYDKIVNKKLDKIFMPYIHNLIMNKYKIHFPEYSNENTNDKEILKNLKYIYNTFFLEYTTEELYNIMTEKRKTINFYNEIFNGLILYNPITDYKDLFGKYVLGLEINSSDIYCINKVQNIFIKRLSEMCTFINESPSIYICY